MARNRSLRIDFRRARVEAFFCLLAMLLGPGQIFPGLLAMGAALEGSHTVRVGTDAAGFHLILSHERGQASESDFNPRHHPQHPAHRHGVAAGILCLVADRGACDPDHVANFATGGDWEQLQRLSAVPVRALGEMLLQPIRSAATLTTMQSTRLGSCQNHRPPSGTSLSCLLRSTVLLV